MELVCERRRRCVREGYQMLLVMDGELSLPREGFPVLRDYYAQVMEVCLTWAETVEGERLREQFLTLSDLRERSGFRTRHYRFWMEYPWESDGHLAVVCHSRLEEDLRRSAQIWNCAEQTLLPLRQVRRLFSESLERPGVWTFLPHGIYPVSEELILFRNSTEKAPAMEKRVPFLRGHDKSESEGQRRMQKKQKKV